MDFVVWRRPCKCSCAALDYVLSTVMECRPSNRIVMQVHDVYDHSVCLEHVAWCFDEGFDTLVDIYFTL